MHRRLLCGVCGNRSQIEDSNTQQKLATVNVELSDRDKHEFALQQVALHQDKAGLKHEFRSHDPFEEVCEVDFVEADDLPADAFWNRYVARHIPVVVLNAVSPQYGWSPSIQLSAGGLAAAFADAAIRVRVAPQQGNVFGNLARLQEPHPQIYDMEEMSLGKYIQLLQEPPLRYYAARLELQEQLPELLPEIPSHWGLPWKTAFGQPYKMGTIAYIGACQQATPLHYDDMENLVFIAEGSKTFTLYPPSQSQHLYPAPARLGTHYSSAPITAFDAEAPEAQQFPRLQDARGCTVTLPKGSMLYLPCCWWHSVRGSEDANISFNYWFAQRPGKEDAQLYRRHLQWQTDRWLKQLSTMDLPNSVMQEAYNEGPRAVDQKAREREQFSWDAL